MSDISHALTAIERLIEIGIANSEVHGATKEAWLEQFNMIKEHALTGAALYELPKKADWVSLGYSNFVGKGWSIEFPVDSPGALSQDRKRIIKLDSPLTALNAIIGAAGAQ